MVQFFRSHIHKPKRVVLNKGVFRIQSNTYDWVFCENSWRRLAAIFVQAFHHSVSFHVLLGSKYAFAKTRKMQHRIYKLLILTRDFEWENLKSTFIQAKFWYWLCCKGILWKKMMKKSNQYCYWSEEQKEGVITMSNGAKTTILALVNLHFRVNKSPSGLIIMRDYFCWRHSFCKKYTCFLYLLHCVCFAFVTWYHSKHSRSKPALESLGKGMKYVQSLQWKHKNQVKCVVLMPLLLTLNIFHIFS